LTSCEDIHRNSGGNFDLSHLICQQEIERKMGLSAQGDDTVIIELQAGGGSSKLAHSHAPGLFILPVGA
jgi:hypothetical protein